MRQKQRFVPATLDALEQRVVMTASHVARGLSVVVAGLTPREQVLSRRRQPIIGEINQAFASFTSDYQQARATYFASIFGTPTPSAATTQVFIFYTKQRVILLANQVISSFLQVPQGTAHAQGQPAALKRLVDTKIVNPSGADPVGTLAASLIQTIPPAGTSGATASLYSLTQDNAIESAQVAVINGVNIIKNGDFGNQTKSH